MSFDLTQLANDALVHLRPEILVMGAKAADGAASETGKQVISWLRDHFIGTKAEPALEDAVAHPSDEDRLEILALQLKVALKENESLQQQLSQFLKTLQPGVIASQSAVIRGKQNRTVQVSGSGNDVRVH